MNPKLIGEKSEGMVLAKFLELDWIVLMPFGDSQRYDFVIDRGNGFERIQVKTFRFKQDYIEFNPSSSQAHRGKKRQGYKNQIDFFACFCPENKKIYLIKVDDCGEAGVKLRITPPKNNQSKFIRYAKDYEL